MSGSSVSVLVAGLTLLFGMSACVATAPKVAMTNSSEEAKAWRVHRGTYFERMWGIDIIGVRLLSSDWMLQFKYRIIDPEKAKTLMVRQAKPYLVDQVSGAKLAVPAMENIGELRQTPMPTEGRTYFIIFGNANKIVQRGNRVNIEIGSFIADEMIVE